MKFRKKPVVVEAERYAYLAHYLGENAAKLPDGVCVCKDTMFPHIHTLEGNMVVSDGDWIITGVKGERYPCKPDIFEATYEPVSRESVTKLMEPSDRELTLASLRIGARECRQVGQIAAAIRLEKLVASLSSEPSRKCELCANGGVPDGAGLHQGNVLCSSEPSAPLIKDDTRWEPCGCTDLRACSRCMGSGKVPSATLSDSRTDTERLK